jgi:hypothetical protein
VYRKLPLNDTLRFKAQELICMIYLNKPSLVSPGFQSLSADPIGKTKAKKLKKEFNMNDQVQYSTQFCVHGCQQLVFKRAFFFFSFL